MDLKSQQMVLFLFNNKDALQKQYQQDKQLSFVMLIALLIGLSVYTLCFEQVQSITFLNYLYCLLFSVVVVSLFYLVHSVIKLHRLVRLANKIHVAACLDKLGLLSQQDIDKSIKSFKI